MVLLKAIKEKWSLKNTTHFLSDKFYYSIILFLLFTSIIYFLFHTFPIKNSFYPYFFCSNHMFLTIAIFAFPILSFSPINNNLAIELCKRNNRWLSHHTVLPQANKCYLRLAQSYLLRDSHFLQFNKNP